MTNPFKWFWNVATLKTKLVIVAFALVLLAVAWFYGCKDTRPDIQDDNAYKALQGQNDILREQNVGLRKEKDGFKAEAQKLELERDGLRVELEKFGAKAAEGVQKQKEAAEQYEKDIAIIGVDVPVLDRCLRYCSSRADAGFPCRPNADAYCKLHYGNAGNE